MEMKPTNFDLESQKEKYSDAKDLTPLNDTNDDSSKLSAHHPATIEPIKVNPTVTSNNAINLKRTIEKSMAASKTECSSDGKGEMEVQTNSPCDKNESQANSPGKNTIKDSSAGTSRASVPMYIFGPKPPINPGLFDCHKCSMNFESLAILNSHNTSQHVNKSYDPKKPIVCDICDRSFKLFPHLVSHRNSTHRTLNPLYPATCLTKEGVGNANVKKLDTVSTIGDGNHGDGDNENAGGPPVPKKGSFACSKCPRTFAREKGLNSHFRYAHIDKIPEGPRPFICDICNKSFLIGLALGTHRKAVHEKFRRK